MKKINAKLLLILILILALAVRVYKVDVAPSSISWDEANVGVNAEFLSNYNRDEYGKFLPLYFKSFGDDKHPVHIYLTAIFVKFLGLSEFSIRLPAAIFGLFNVLLLYFLAKLLFKNEFVALSAGFFLAISPFSIHFSRFNHEANFTLFFFLLGLIFFYQSFKKKYFLFFSILCFVITFIAYHPAKIVTPLVVLALIILYFKNIISNNKKNLLISIVFLFTFTLVLFLNPQLLGVARVSQTSLNKASYEKTMLYQITKSDLLGRLNLTFIQYSWHFSPKFLFISGDKNPRLSWQGSGEFYKIDAIFLILGVIYLLRKRSKEGVVLLILSLAAPLPASLVAEAPHAARSMFMMGSWHIISALGFYYLIILARKKMVQISLVIFTIFFLMLFLIQSLNFYYVEYIKKYAIEWQYGMKQVVEFAKLNPSYTQIYMTDVRHQPYIFFLFYLRTPLPNYLNTVVFNKSESSKGYNLISYFDKYYFGGWDTVMSFPHKGVLYILTPSEYDGLLYKSNFKVKELVKYPDESIAFYLVSGD